MPTEDDLDSIGILPPDFGPGLLTYPAIDSFIRTTGPSIGSNVYPGLATQFALLGGKPVLRDREPVYLWEPNGIVLGAGYYDARLLSSYLNLPLYSTFCCATGKFPSSSSLSSSSVRGCNCAGIKSVKLIISGLPATSVCSQEGVGGTEILLPTSNPCAFTVTDNVVNLTFNATWSNGWVITVTTNIGLVVASGIVAVTTDCTQQQQDVITCQVDKTTGIVRVVPVLGP